MNRMKGTFLWVLLSALLLAMALTGCKHPIPPPSAVHDPTPTVTATAEAEDTGDLFIPSFSDFIESAPYQQLSTDRDRVLVYLVYGSYDADIVADYIWELEYNSPLGSDWRKYVWVTARPLEDSEYSAVAVMSHMDIPEADTGGRYWGLFDYTEAYAEMRDQGLSFALADFGLDYLAEAEETDTSAAALTPAVTPTATPTATVAPTPTATPTSAPTATPTPTPAPTVTPTAAPTPEPVAQVPDGVLPDPYSFFFGDEEVKYKTDLEGGRYIATFYFSAETTGIEEDYITLLREGDYGLTLRSSSSSQSDASYVFDYTGTADIPNFDLSGKTDMALYISTHVWEKRLEVQIWYAVDGFTFQDFGDRSSLGNLADICIEETTCRASGGPLSPEKFGGTPSPGSSGSSGSTFSGSSGSGSQTTRCTKCHGTGKITCSRCDGSGGKYVYVSGGPNYSGNGQSTSTRKWENCSKCHGSGKVDCTTCGGSGKV